MGQEGKEIVVVDVCSPLRVTIMPLIHLINITALSWLFIGWADRPGTTAPPQLRGAVIVIWLLLVAWVFIRPLVKSRRRRFIVTDQRIILAGFHTAKEAEIIPLHAVYGAARLGNDLLLRVAGVDGDVTVKGVAKTLKVSRSINALIKARQPAMVQRVYY